MARFKYEKDEDGNEWAVYDNVPIFKEHVGSDGTVYDKKLLQCIADNNNERVEDTGDYCPIVGWHTPADNDPAKDPPIIGYADSFKVGKFGKKKPIWAIYARFRVRKDKHRYFQDHPRRSVEVWPEDKPENRYIDPIAILGAETPRQDLGLTYSKSGTKLRYEASFAGGYNTYIPSAGSGSSDKVPGSSVGEEEMEEQNAKKGPRPVRKPRRVESGDYEKGFDPERYVEEIQYGLKEFLKGTAGDSVGKIGKRAVGAVSSGAGNPTEVQEGFGNLVQDSQVPEKMEADGMALSEQDIQQIVEGLKPTIIDIVQQEIGAVVSATDNEGPEDFVEEGEAKVPMEEESGEPEAPEDSVVSEEGDVELDDEQKMAKEMFAKFCEKYGLMSDEADMAQAGQYMASMDPKMRDQLRKYMASCATDEEKEAYAKCYAGDGKCSDGKDTYSKGSTMSDSQKDVERYRKEAAQVSEKYSKLQEKYAKLEKDYLGVQDQLVEAKKAQRYSKISERLALLETEGYNFDKENELEFCMQLNDNMLEQHLSERIPQHYSKTPSPELLPVEKSEEIKPVDQKSVKYSKAAQVATRELRAKGHKNASYNKVLDYMVQHDSDACPPAEAVL